MGPRMPTPSSWDMAQLHLRVLTLPQVDLLAPALSALVVPRHPSADSLGWHDRCLAARDFAYAFAF